MTDPLVARLAPRDYREVARYVIGAPTYEWIRSGSGDGFASDNEAAFRRRRLRSRVLVDVSAVSTATTVLGAPIAAPVMIGPMGLQRAVHPDGELAMAEGAAAGRQPPRRGRQRDDEHRGHRRRLTGPAALVPALQLGRPGCPGRRHRPGRGGRCPGDRAARQHGDRRQPHLARRSASGCPPAPSSPTSTARPRTPARTPGSTSPGSARSPRCRSCPRGS